MHNSGPQRNHTVELPASFVFLMLFCLCGFVLGCVYYWAWPTTYESKASFRVTETEPEVAEALPRVFPLQPELQRSSQLLPVAQQPFRLELKVYGFNSVPIDECRFDQQLRYSSTLRRAFDDGALGTLDLFEELKEKNPGGNLILEDPVGHMRENLSAVQSEDDPEVWEASYLGSHADDTQTVLRSILYAYEAQQKDDFRDNNMAIHESLGKLYTIAEDSLAQEKANKASEGVIAKLEERLAEIVEERHKRKFYSDSITQPNILKFEVLKDPSYGEPVFQKKLWKTLLGGTLAGFVAWIVFTIILLLIRASSQTSQQNQKVELPASFVFLILFCLCGFVLGCVFYWTWPTTYESKASFRVAATGLELPVEGFNIEEFTDAEFDQHLPNTGAIQRAFDEGKLGTLDLFEELKEDPADHMKENLSVAQNQSENKNDDVWEVSYFGSHPDDTQTVLKSILSAYESELDEDFRDMVMDSRKSLGKLYKIAQESLAQGQANNASQGVIARLEDRLAEIVEQRQNAKFYSDSITPDSTTLSSDASILRFKVLEDPSYGEPVFPVLWKTLLVGTLAGFVVWLVFTIILLLIRVRSLPMGDQGDADPYDALLDLRENYAPNSQAVFDN